jgi:hypothetical protein
MLRKVIKNDIKTQWLPLVLIFAFAIVIPLLFYVMSGNLSEEWRFTLRLLVGSLGAFLVIFSTMILSALKYESDFNGKTSYLTQMLPVSVKTLLFSKTLFFFVSTLFSFIFALLCISLSIMNLSPFTLIYGFFEYMIQSMNSVNEYFASAVIIIRFLLGIICFYSFICAGGAFGHLFGTKRKAAETLFEIVVAIIYVLYSTLFNGLIEFNGSTSVDFALYCIDSVVAIAVTVGFFLFANHVFTKKINVL